MMLAGHKILALMKNQLLIDLISNICLVDNIKEKLMKIKKNVVGNYNQHNTRLKINFFRQNWTLICTFFDIN